MDVVKRFLDGDVAAFQQMLTMPPVTGEFSEVYSYCFQLYAEYFANDEDFPPSKIIGLLEQAAAMDPCRGDIWAQLGSEYLQLVQAHIEDPEEELLAANDARAKRCYTAACAIALEDSEIQQQTGELHYLLLRLEASRMTPSRCWSLLKLTPVKVRASRTHTSWRPQPFALRQRAALTQILGGCGFTWGRRGRSKDGLSKASQRTFSNSTPKEKQLRKSGTNASLPCRFIGSTAFACASCCSSGVLLGLKLTRKLSYVSMPSYPQAELVSADQYCS